MKITKRQLIRIIREERYRLHEEGEVECGETCKKLGKEALAMTVYGLSVSESPKQALADLTEWLGEAPHDAAKWLIDWSCSGLSGWDGWGEHTGTVSKVCSGLGKAGTMPLAIQEKAFWAMAKGIELIPLSMIRDFTAKTWPDTQGGKLALADQKKAKKKTGKIEDKSTKAKETKQEGRSFKISQRQLRRIIREAIAPGPTGFSLQDIALGIIRDNPGMGGEDIAAAVQFQPMDPPVERNEIFAALDELQETGRVFFDIEEDEWWTTEDWKRYNEEGGVWSDERDYEAGFYR